MSLEGLETMAISTSLQMKLQQSLKNSFASTKIAKVNFTQPETSNTNPSLHKNKNMDQSQHLLPKSVIKTHASLTVAILQDPQLGLKIDL
jgi:cytochrome c biogenesis protein ResB